MITRNQIRTIVNKVGLYTFRLDKGFTINIFKILRKVSPTEFVTFPTASPALSTNTIPTGDYNRHGSRLTSVPGFGSVHFTSNSDTEVVIPITNSFNAFTRRSTRNRRLPTYLRDYCLNFFFYNNRRNVFVFRLPHSKISSLFETVMILIYDQLLLSITGCCYVRIYFVC